MTNPDAKKKIAPRLDGESHLSRVGLALLLLAMTGFQEPPKPPPNAEQAQINVTARIETDRGVIHIQLLADESPLASASFAFLAQKGFFDGQVVYRVVGKNLVEMGCPEGKGIGWPGYQFEDRFPDGLRHDRAGWLTTLNLGPNTNGSRFGITLSPMPQLDGRSVIFGMVADGLDVVEALEPMSIIRRVTVSDAASTLLKRFERQVQEWEQRLKSRYPNGFSWNKAAKAAEIPPSKPDDPKAEPRAPAKP